MTRKQNSERGKYVELAGFIDDKTHRLTARVYFADTDFSGAVYHGRYLEFLERGRSDFLRCIGVHHTDLLNNEDGALFWVVRRMEIDFQAGAVIDDVLQIETQLTFVGGARCMMAQKILRGDEVLIEAEITAALINKASRPRRFPAEWKEAFSALVTNYDG